jgi:TM2 domain-containing membrane protein YozV
VKGRILDYSVQTNSGIISGDDGRRYTFVGAEWRGSSAPVRGMYVDFEAMQGGAEARDIYVAAESSGLSEIFGGAKNRVVAGVLAIILGWLGVHKFYLGYINQGIMLAAASIAIIIISQFVGFLGFIGFLIWAIGLVEGIIYISKTDGEFETIYVTGDRPWF